MKDKILRVAVMLTALSAASCAYLPVTPPAETEPLSALCRDRVIRTKPFEHSTVSVRDTESIVHVPGDDNLWIGDDHSNAVFEFDRVTGQYRSRVTAQDIVAAFPQAGQCEDEGRRPRTECSHIGELEVVAYDPVSRTLLLFNTVSNPKLDPPVDKPAVFRLRKKHGRGRFRLVDWRELPAGHRFGPAVVVEERLYLAVGEDVVEFDVARNRFSDTDDKGNSLPPVATTAEGKIVGMAFDGSSLWLLTHRKKLVRVEWSSKVVVESYDVARFGITKAKGLGFGAGEFFVVDGEHPNLIHVLRFGRPAKMAWWRGGGQSLSCG